MKINPFFHQPLHPTPLSRGVSSSPFGHTSFQNVYKHLEQQSSRTDGASDSVLFTLLVPRSF